MFVVVVSLKSGNNGPFLRSRCGHERPQKPNQIQPNATEQDIRVNILFSLTYANPAKPMQTWQKGPIRPFTATTENIKNAQNVEELWKFCVVTVWYGKGIGSY